MILAPSDADRAYAALPWPEFRARWERLPTKAQRDEALRIRFRFDRASFLKYCFPSAFSMPWNAYHYEVLNREWLTSAEREGRVTWEADAAPRGIAKTTILKGELAWAIAYGMERVVLWLSAGHDQAIRNSEDLRAWVSDGDSPFAALYGPVRVTGGLKRWTATPRSGLPVTMIPLSFGTQVRGTNERTQRPTLAVIDDGERPDRVRKPERRREWWAFTHEDIAKVGPRQGGLWVRIRGTVLHPDSGLANLLKRPGVDARRYQVLMPNRRSDLGFPEREDLWETCHKLYLDLVNGGPDKALAFYHEHKAEMDAGAVPLDPHALPIWRVYEIIWTEGLGAALKDLWNLPRAAGSKYFRVSEFARCRVEGNRKTGGVVVWKDGRRSKLSDLEASIRVDPIPGKKLGTMGDDGGSGAGDFAAIVVILRDQYGYAAIVECWLGRARDGEQIAKMWELGEKWLPHKASVESNGFARLLGVEFRRQQEERRNKGLFWQMDPIDDVSKRAKEDRIATLEAPCAASWIQFAENIPQELFHQFDGFPDGDHDDGPDAVEGAWRMSGGVRAGMSSASGTGIW